METALLLFSTWPEVTPMGGVALNIDWIFDEFKELILNFLDMIMEL